MNAFVITSISLAALGGLVRLLLLVFLDYPRKQSRTRGDDAMGVLLAIAWCAWGIWLLSK